jgi:transposase-like protein
MPPQTLNKWVLKAEMAKKQKLAASGASPSSAVMAVSNPKNDKERIAQLEGELASLGREFASLRQKNEQLEMDRAILKKAAAFFAKESE